MKRFIWAAMLVAPLTIACSGDDSDDDTDGGDSDSDTDGWVDDGVSPVLENATATCLEGSQSSGKAFKFTGTYDDPQGPDNIDNIQKLTVYTPAGQPILPDQTWITCRDGNCTGSLLETQSGGIQCVNANEGKYLFKSALVDVDGNTGPEVTWEWIPYEDDSDAG